MARTLLDKVWEAHTVRTLPSGQTQLLIGLHLIHEVTTPQAFQMLRDSKLKVRMPERTFGTLSVSGGSGNSFSHSGGGGNVTISGAANLTSAAPDTIVVQNAASTNLINFAGGATVWLAASFANCRVLAARDN